MTAILENIPENARIWIYQADRKLNESELSLVRQKAEDFVRQWAAHGKQLAATFSLERDQFLIFMVDESVNMASGCSIDSSVGVVRELENELSISFLDRSKVAFLINGEVDLMPFNRIRDAISEGKISENTLFFNNAIETVADLENNWLVPAGSSWLKRYF